MVSNSRSKSASNSNFRGTADVDFDLALANGTEAKAPLQAFRFEVQGASLVVLRETALEADIAKVLTIEPGAGRVHLRVFLDQARGRLLVHSAEGAPLAELEVPDKHAPDGIQLVNKKGDLRLERLRISRWNGDRPSAVQGGAARAQAADGGILYGDLTAYDSEAHQFIIRTSKGDERMDAARVLEIVLAPTEVAAKANRFDDPSFGDAPGGRIVKGRRKRRLAQVSWDSRIGRLQIRKPAHARVDWGRKDSARFGRSKGPPRTGWREVARLASGR